jgi:hypothetical protein
MSALRPEVKTASASSYVPQDGTAYLMIYSAVQSKSKLIHGRLHQAGESCAIGSFWDVNPKIALHTHLIDEIAAVNDSVPDATPIQRRLHVMRWLRWRLGSVGMPGFEKFAPKRAQAKRR